jgi:benzoyl-CoA reductase/2-hydroxyglutaryl-CoA dehydratase subunit BcrC/BadD/HgdB
MTGVHRKFQSDLERALGVTIDEDRLRETIDLYNKNRNLISVLYKLRSDEPSLISGSDLSCIMNAAMIMDRRLLTNHLSSLVEHLRDRKGTSQRIAGKRILLAGGMCSQPDIHDVLETSGGYAVWDDLCTGTRYFQDAIEISSNPVEAIARRYFERNVCPTKHFDLHQRAEYLVRTAKEHKIDGVIFLLIKFCDPHGFDYPFMKQSLDAAGIPNLKIEIEAGDSPPGPLVTRIEAFMEMLE